MADNTKEYRYYRPIQLAPTKISDNEAQKPAIYAAQAQLARPHLRSIPTRIQLASIAAFLEAILRKWGTLGAHLFLIAKDRIFIYSPPTFEWRYSVFSNSQDLSLRWMVLVSTFQRFATQDTLTEGRRNSVNCTGFDSTRRWLMPGPRRLQVA